MGDRAAALAREAMASLQSEGLRDYLTARCEEALRVLQREAAEVARKSEATYTRLADEHEAMPVSAFVDERTKLDLVANFAHIAHEAHDIAESIEAL